MNQKHLLSSETAPLIALVACPYNYEGYVQRENMAIDDLGLGALYQVLYREGYRVVLFDSQLKVPVFTPPYLYLLEKLAELKPDYIGFSDPIISFKRSLELSRKLFGKIFDERLK